MSYAPVVIVDYDPRWAELYIKERDRILAAIGKSVAAIEHCGSTSVPGLAAKPIIDILAGVRSLADAPDCFDPLARLGYWYHPEYEIMLPDRRFFERGGNYGDLPIHLHMCRLGGIFWQKHIVFRDSLRAQPETARAYAELKRGLAGKYRHDREGYTNAKTDFIEGVLLDAGYKSS